MAVEALIPQREFAKLIGVSRWTIFYALKSKQLNCIHIGRRVMFHPSELERVQREGLKPIRKKVG